MVPFKLSCYGFSKLLSWFCVILTQYFVFPFVSSVCVCVYVSPFVLFLSTIPMFPSLCVMFSWVPCLPSGVIIVLCFTCSFSCPLSSCVKLCHVLVYVSVFPVSLWQSRVSCSVYLVLLPRWRLVHLCQLCSLPSVYLNPLSLQVFLSFVYFRFSWFRCYVSLSSSCFPNLVYVCVSTAIKAYLLLISVPHLIVCFWVDTSFTARNLPLQIMTTSPTCCMQRSLLKGRWFGHQLCVMYLSETSDLK